MTEKYVIMRGGKKYVLVKELFDIISKCNLWCRTGKCADRYNKPCMMYSKCKIVRNYDMQMMKYLGKGEPSIYLPGVKFGPVKKKSNIFLG